MKKVFFGLFVMLLFSCNSNMSGVSDSVIEDSIKSYIVRGWPESIHIKIDSFEVISRELITNKELIDVLLEKTQNDLINTLMRRSEDSISLDKDKTIYAERQIINWDKEIDSLLLSSIDLQNNIFKESKIKSELLAETRDSLKTEIEKVNSIDKNNPLYRIKYVTSSTEGINSETVWVYLDKNWKLVLVKG